MRGSSEAVAKLFSSSKAMEEIAKEEILEETGYEVPLSAVELVQSCPVSVGVGGEKMTLFYAEVRTINKNVKTYRADFLAGRLHFLSSEKVI